MKWILNVETLRNIFLITLFVLVFSFTYNFFSPKGLNIFNANVNSMKKVSQSTSNEFNVISIDEALEFFYNENTIFIDARSPSDYEKGHIPGALNLSTKEFDNYLETVFSLPRNKLIIIYCESIHCNLSHELAVKLKNFGIENIYLMVEGINEWKKRSLPLNKY